MNKAYQTHMNPSVLVFIGLYSGTQWPWLDIVSAQFIGQHLFCLVNVQST